MSTATETAVVTPTPVLPEPRGELSAFLVDQLGKPAGPLPPLPRLDDDPLAGEDLHLALYACYELHYRGFAGVDETWEWEPSLLAFRATMEEAFEAALRAALPVDRPADVVAALCDVLAGPGGPSLSARMLETGTVGELRELLVHRSAYQLKEADPHTWAIPRLAGRAKAALVRVQAEEYGGGDERAMHSTLFAATMRALDLDDGYGAYLDVLPGATLATVNLISLFGLHRRLRGALVGHLTAFEMTSVAPMARYSRALARLGVSPVARTFYDVHVEADAEHDGVARDLAASLSGAEPALAGDVVFGARALLLVEERFTRRLLDAWGEGRTSLLRPLPPR